MGLSGANNEEKIWNYLRGHFNEYGTASLMGNMYAESGLNPINLQNTFEKKLGMSDEEYTKAVDDGSYKNFVKDGAGYGLIQLTYWTRKRDFLAYVQGKNKSIGDLETQLEYVIKELKSNYSSVYKTLQNAKSVREASDVVLLKFEKPKNQSESVQKKRAEYGQKYYDKYAVSISKKVKEVKEKNVKLAYEKPQVFNGSFRGVYKTTANLRMRKGAGTNKELIKVIPEGASVIVSGWYTSVNSIKWFLVTYGNDTGFCSSDYLKRT